MRRFRGKRRHKYGAKKTYVNGIRFHSKGEANRYKELLWQEKAGLISDLKLQVRFPLVVNERLIGHFVADFQYNLKATGERITEDYKGYQTTLSKWQHKLFRALYPDENLIITSAAQ